MCKVTDCQNKPVAKGLCAKHYMRLRRNGDANTVRKRGPVSERLAGMSARTWTRFKHASLVFQAMGYSLEDYQWVIEQSKRRNGRVNVSGFLRFVQDILEDRTQRVIHLGPPKE
jgi:hypothetical protein